MASVYRIPRGQKRKLDASADSKGKKVLSQRNHLRLADTKVRNEVRLAPGVRVATRARALTRGGLTVGHETASSA